MIFKLSARNLFEKPVKAAVTVFVIAVAVAVMFCIFSYNSSVYSYVYAVETSDSGCADITVSYRSDSPRINSTTALASISDRLEFAVGALSVYGIVNENDYIYLRGFEKEDLEKLFEIDFVQGSLADVTAGSDNVIISESTAKAMNLALDSEIAVTVMNKTENFYVAAIAKDGGYFAGNSPYTFIGVNNGVSRFFDSVWGGFYSEIYLKLNDGVNIGETMDLVKEIPSYSNMKVEKSADLGAIQDKTESLVATIDIVGAAVVLLSLAAIVALFATNEKTKRVYISKLTSIGADKKQIVKIFAAENSIYAAAGAVIGCGLAVLLYYLLLKFTLGSAMTFAVSAWRLLIAVFAGALAALFSGFVPMILARKRSVRENFVANTKDGKRFLSVFYVAYALLLAASLVCEFTVSGLAAGYFGLVSFGLIIIGAIVYAPLVLNLIYGATSLCKKGNVEFKIAARSVSRTGSSRRGAQMLTLAMFVCVMLFVAWNLTTTIFSSLTGQFENMILVSNVPVDETLPSQFEQCDGVRSAIPVIWKKVQVDLGGETKSVNVFGTADILDCIDFEYVTDEAYTHETLSAGLATDKRYVFMDKYFADVLGVKVGDALTLKLEDKTADFVVGGILRNKIFSGNYFVIAREQMSDAFGLPAFDTLLLFADDVQKVSKDLRVRFADKNYFVIGALDSYRYEVEATDSVFDLIGVFAFIISITAAASVASNTVVARQSREVERSQYLVAGMSKKSMFETEVFEHIILAVTGFVPAAAFSFLLTRCLIDGILLFGLYLDYVYAPILSVAVPAAFAAAYIVMPFVSAYKRRYTVSARE